MKSNKRNNRSEARAGSSIVGYREQVCGLPQPLLPLALLGSICALFFFSTTLCFAGDRHPEQVGGQEKESHLNILPLTMKEDLSSFSLHSFQQVAALVPKKEGSGSSFINDGLNAQQVLHDYAAAPVLEDVIIEKEQDQTRLMLTFTKTPEYLIRQRGEQENSLILSFKGTRLGGEFEIPDVSGFGISVRPQKQKLQLFFDIVPQLSLSSTDIHEDGLGGAVLTLSFDAGQDVGLATNLPTEDEKILPIPLGASPVNNKSVKVPSQDQQEVLVGLDLLREKNRADAQLRFEQALSHNPSNLKARLHLVELLQEQEKEGAVVRLLAEGVQILPASRLLRKKYARYLIDKQQIEKAAALLKKMPRPSVQEDPEYFALLAALFQQQGQFDKAARVYGSLVALNRENGVWWLGLGLSMDQSGNLEYARKAYQKTLSVSGLDPQLKEYVHSRLKAL